MKKIKLFSSLFLLTALFFSCSNASTSKIITSDGNNLREAILQNDSQNLSKMLMDGLMLANDSIITVVLMGVFLAMFLTMIPQLTNLLFKIQISEKYYETVKNDGKIIWNRAKKWYEDIKK